MPHKDPEARRAYLAARYAKNRKEIRSSQAAFLKENPEKMAESLARLNAWNKTHPKSSAIRQARYRKNHPEKIVEQSKARYRADPEKELQRNTAWRKANPDKSSALYAKRSARKRSAPVNDLTAADWDAIKQQFAHRCAYCGKKPKRLTQDHITPLVKGGNHTLQNVIPACQKCNSSKGTKPPPIPVQPLLI